MSSRPVSSSEHKFNAHRLSLVHRLMLPLAGSLLSLGAIAQTADPTLDTITITGRSSPESSPDLDIKSRTGSRLDLPVRETPASIEVISQDTMQQRGARTIEEALRGAVGVSAGGNPGSPGISSTRGFTAGFLNYLYDGTRVSTPTMSSRPQDTWNYERIEVLKGPASVLFGEGGIGGAINFVTKRADRNNPGQQAMLAYGSFGSLRAGLGAGGTLGQAGAYRVDFSYNRSDGWIDRSAQRLDHLTSSLSFDLSSTLKLDLALDALQDNIQSYWGTPLVPASFASRPTTVVRDSSGRVIDRSLARSNYNVRNGLMDADSLWGRARLTWQLTPQWTLRNELSLYKADRHWRNAESLSFVAPDRIDRDQVDIAHQHKVSGNRLDLGHRGKLGGMDNRFVIGLEYSKTDFRTQRRFSDGSAATDAALQVSALNPSVGGFNNDPALASGAGNRTDMNTGISTTSFFAEDALKLNPAWSVVAGVRTDRIRLERNVDDLNTGTNSSFGASYNSNSVRVGTVFDVARNTALYAQYANAVAPAGTANLLILSATNSSFPLTRGKQFEVGIKQSLSAARLDWTLALYQIEQNNVLSRDPANPAITVNNGQQSSRGVELSAAWRASKNWTLSGNLAALDARFDTLIEAGGVSRIGNTPPNVPQRLANLWVDYRFDSMPLLLGAGLNQVGPMYTNNANTVKINGYTLIDLYASWRVKPMQLIFRVRNLGDTLYASWAGANADNQVILGAPRTLEVMAQFEF